MDTIQFHYDKSIFSNLSVKKQQWFNPGMSWMNKYKYRNPNYGPAFFGSTTFLVWITDAWHFFQNIMLSCFVLAIIFCLNYYFELFLMPKEIVVVDILLFIGIKGMFGVEYIRVVVVYYLYMNLVRINGRKGRCSFQ